MINRKMLRDFLEEVNYDFPVPLTEKSNLQKLTDKLYNSSSLFYNVENNKIIALVAGYMNDDINHVAFISIVATLPQARRRGIARQLINDFIKSSAQKDMKLVHIYTDKSNEAAIALYRKVGFDDYVLDDEPRPNDVHLVYYIKEKK